MCLQKNPLLLLLNLFCMSSCTPWSNFRRRRRNETQLFKLVYESGVGKRCCWKLEICCTFINTGFVQVPDGLTYSSLDLGNTATTKLQVIVAKFEAKLGPSTRTILGVPAEGVEKTKLR